MGSDGISMNDRLGNIWKEAVVAYPTVLGETKILKSGQAGSGPQF
jgi:hypothetical protein